MTVITYQDRSEDVNDLFKYNYGFIARWGITIFLFILVFSLLILAFIPYPETVTVRARLTSLNAPKEVKVRLSARLTALFVKEGQKLKRGDIIGVLESAASYDEVKSVVDCIKKLKEVSYNENILIADTILTKYKNLGELQQSCEIFVHALSIYKQYLAEGFYVRKKAMLRKDLNKLLEIHNNLEIQKDLIKEDILLSEENFKATQSLKNQKVVSSFDYRSEKSRFILKKMELPQINANLLSNENNTHEKEKEIEELNNQIIQQKIIFEQALNSFNAQIEVWQSKFVLTAPIDGLVIFSIPFQVNQQVQSDQTLCYIAPDNIQFFLEAYIPQQNVGIVKEWQKVLLTFDTYPSQQFGIVEANIALISKIPNDSGYYSKFMLPKGLQSHCGKRLFFKEGLFANAEIIINKRRLLERLFPFPFTY